MQGLTFRNARSTIENAIVDALALAYARRTISADVAALAGAASTTVEDDALRYVTTPGRVYQWKRDSLATDDGDQVIKPLDLTAVKPGRWLKTSSTSAAGYLQSCELYNDDASEDTINDRLLARKPAILISFEGAKNRPRSLTPGALYVYEASFTALVISTSMRGGQSARQGSRRTVETQVDPGTAAIIGDIKELLAGSDLGLADVMRVEVGDEHPVTMSLARATAIEEISLTVYATLTPGDASVPLSDPYMLSVQQQIPEADGSLDNIGQPSLIDGGQLAALALVPAAPQTLARGAVLQLAALATFGDGDSALQTTKCSWRSSDDGVAMVTSDGKLLAVGVGNATITATDQASRQDSPPLSISVS